MNSESEQRVKENTIELVGEIIAADTEEGTGKILIFENEHLMENIYCFSLLKGLSSRTLLRDAFLNEVKVNILKEALFNFVEGQNNKKNDLSLIITGIELL